MISTRSGAGVDGADQAAMMHQWLREWPLSYKDTAKTGSLSLTITSVTQAKLSFMSNIKLIQILHNSIPLQILYKKMGNIGSI
jgi:hypothetical protein